MLGPSADATITPFVTTSGATLLEGEYRRRFDDGGFDLGGVIAVDAGLEGDLDAGCAARFAATGAFALARRLRRRLRPRRGQRRQLPRAVRLFRRRPADQHRRASAAPAPTSTSQLGTVAFQSLRDDEDDRHHPLRPAASSPTGGSIDAPGIGGRLGIDAELARHPARRRQQHGARRRRRRLAARLDRCRTGVLASDHRGGARSTSTRSGTTPTSPTASRSRADADRRRRAALAAGAHHRPRRARHRADRPGDLLRHHRRDRRPERGQPACPSSTRPTSSRSTAFPASTGSRPGCAPTSASATPATTRPAGRSALTLGRVLRAEPRRRVPRGHRPRGPLVGLCRRRVARLRARALPLVNRALFDADLDFSRNEFALAYDSERAGPAAPPTSTSPRTTSTRSSGRSRRPTSSPLDARYRVHPNWEVRGLWRYDVASDSNLRAGAGDHLRQRMRRVRPFGLAPLYLIG